MPTDVPPVPDRFGAARATDVLRYACVAVGVESGDARLLRLGENALFHLPVVDIVVRIARSMHYWSDVCNEVNVSRWLGDVGFHAAKVDRAIAQPIQVDGHPVTFWQFIHGRPGGPDDIELLGAVLHGLHQLSPPRNFRLPDEEILGRVSSRIENASVPDIDKEYLIGRLSDLDAAVAELSFPLAAGPTHGDAHSENLMISDAGDAVLIDLERFAWGQPEWDLAMTATEYDVAGWWTAPQYEAFASAYGMDIMSWGGYPVLRDVHAIKMTTWLMQNVNESEDIASEFQARMRTLRGDPDRPKIWRPF